MAKLYFHYSSMNAGKSTALLQANHNYIERGMHPVLYTAKLDDREGKGKSAQIGIKQEAETFAEDDDLYPVVKAMNRSSGWIACSLMRHSFSVRSRFRS